MPAPLCVVGPTKAELADYAPSLLSAATAPSGMHIPVGDQLDVEKVVRRYREWEGGVPSALIIALPPESEILKQIPGIEHKLPPELGSSLSPGLALAGIMGSNFPVWVALPDSHLSNSDYRAQRATLADNWRRNYQQHASMTRSEILKSIRSDALNDKEDAEARLSALMKGSTDLDEPSVDCAGDLANAGLIPKAVWSLPDDPQLSIAMMDRDGSYTDPSWVAHLRSLTSDGVHSILTDDSAAKLFVGIWWGHEPRTEDDTFVPLRTLIDTAKWGAAASTENIRTTAKGFAGGMGYPTKSVGDLCEAEELSSWEEGATGDDTTLWFVSRGLDVLTTLRAAPCKPKLNPKWVEQFEQRIRQWPHTRVIRLKVEEDAEYLWRVLNEISITENIQCRAMGCFKSPLVSRTALLETQVPWPDAETRRRQLDAIRQSKNAFDSDGPAGLATDVLSDITDEFERLERHLGSDDKSPISPVFVDGIWDDLVKLRRRLDKALKFLPRESAPESDEPTTKAIPPAITAILERQIAHDPNEYSRVMRRFDLAEVIVKYDVSVLLSTLKQVRPKVVPDAFRALDVRQRSFSGHWMTSIGHWRGLQNEARRLLAETKPGEDTLTGEFIALRRDLCAPNRKTLDQTVATICEMRNRYKGHGFTQEEAIWRGVGADLDKLIREMLEMLPYMTKYLLLRLESRQVRRKDLVLSTKLLSHDNPVFAIQQSVVPKEDFTSDVADGDVCLNHVQPFGLLSLSPWIHFAPSGTTGRDTIWIFDGVKKGMAVYKSPFAPNDALDIRDLASEVTRLIGL